jgi:hypothetical protein
MLLLSALLTHAVRAVLGSAAALSNTATVADVASALTSMVKRSVQFIAASVALPADAAAAADPAACFAAATQMIAAVCVQIPAARIRLASTSGVFSVRGSGAQGAAKLLRALRCWLWCLRATLRSWLTLWRQQDLRCMPGQCWARHRSR